MKIIQNALKEDMAYKPQFPSLKAEAIEIAKNEQKPRNISSMAIEAVGVVNVVSHSEGTICKIHERRQATSQARDTPPTIPSKI